MRRELSSARPANDGQPAADVTAHRTDHRDQAGPSLRSLAARKFVIGTAATAALAGAAGLGVAAPAMTAAADSKAAGTDATATAAAPGTNLLDTMDRTVTTGLGAATTGGTWSPWGASFSVSGGDAHMGVQPGVSARATLEGVQNRDEALSVTFSVPAVPTAGSGSYFGLMLRRQGNGDALYARVKVSPGGTMGLTTKLTTGTKSTDIGSPVTLAGSAVAGRSYTLDAVVSGGSTTTVTARAYAAGTATPAWQTGGSVSVPGGLAVRGSFGFYAYASGTGGQFGVDIDAISGRDLSAPTTSSPSSSPTSSSPSSAPTSSSPSSSPTSPSSSPTSSSPSSSPTSSTGPTPGNPPSGTVDPEGRIGFADSDPVDPTTPVTTPPSTPVTTPPPPPPAGKPGPDNTGPRPGITLRVWTPTGGTYVPAAGEVLENLDIHGLIVVKNPNVVIRNCIVRGNPITDRYSPRPLIDALNATNLQIIDSTITPLFASINNSAGINGGNFTLTRVDIHNTIDGIQMHRSNVRVIDSWIHDTSWFAHSPEQNNTPTHNDGIQIFGGANLVVTGSTVEGTTNSVLQTSPTPGFTPITGMVWADNWLDGGGCSMNINPMSFPSLAPITITGNRFGDHQSLPGCAIIARIAVSPLVLSGNVWDANDQPVVVSKG